MKRVAASLKEDIASASLHQIWRASTNLAGLWSEMNEGRKSTPKENLKPKCSLAGFSKNLQLSISKVQFCSSSGYRLRSIIQAAVVVILEKKYQ